MQRMRVVLPQPLAPAISKISPGLAEKEIFRMAGFSRSRYRKERFSITSGVSSVMGAYLSNTTIGLQFYSTLFERWIKKQPPQINGDKPRFFDKNRMTGASIQFTCVYLWN